MLLVRLLATWMFSWPWPLYQAVTRLTGYVVVCNGRTCWFERRGRSLG